jgi:hypothetical protein
LTGLTNGGGGSSGSSVVASQITKLQDSIRQAELALANKTGVEYAQVAEAIEQMTAAIKKADAKQQAALDKLAARIKNNRWR